jgi:DNA-binding protein Fis
MLLDKDNKHIFKEGIAEFEKILVQKALERTNNNQVLAAKLLGIARDTLRKKIILD